MKTKIKKYPQSARFYFLCQIPEEFGYNLAYSKKGINKGRLTIRFGKDRKVIGYSEWDGCE